MEWMLKKKNGQPVDCTAQVRKAVPAERDALLAMQDKVLKALPDPDYYIPNQPDELADNIANHLVIGVWTGDTPIAMGIVRYDGSNGHNYASYLDVPASDLPLWANADTTIVDPEWRGNQLQKKLLDTMILWRRPEMVGMGCTVSPKNSFSLHNVEAAGFSVHTRREMYGGHDRYLMRCDLLPLPGRYRHFKGNEYQVLGTARHSETEEWMVIYRALYGEQGIWVRPAAMWSEHVDKPGYSGPRFRYIGE